MSDEYNTTLVSCSTESKRRTFLKKTTRQNQKSNSGFGLSDELTCHFDFLHDLAGSVVDLHFNINGVAVVINLDFRKYLQSEEEEKGGKTFLGFQGSGRLTYLLPE